MTEKPTIPERVAAALGSYEFRVRDLHEVNPNSYKEGEFDVVCFDAAGKLRHSHELFHDFAKAQMFADTCSIDDFVDNS